MQFQYEPHRIYIEQEKELLAEITFPAIDAKTVRIEHTYVSDVLRGQGIAARLMEEVVKQLHKEDKKCIATCSYAQEWFKKHPQEHNLLCS